MVPPMTLVTRLVLLLGTPCAASALLLAACSSSELPPPTGGIPSETPTNGGASAKDAGDDAEADDAEADDASSGACSSQTADGPLVGDTQPAGAPPEPAGGIISTGEYWLTERALYGELEPSGLFVQRSLFIEPTGEWTFVEGTTPSATTPPATFTSTTGACTPQGPLSLQITVTCPGPKHLTNYHYTADGPILTLFAPNGGVETYELQ